MPAGGPWAGCLGFMSLAIDDHRTGVSGAERALPGTLSAAGRARAFRRARFHSLLVRFMRFVFPLSVVLLFAGYGFMLMRGIKLEMGSGTLSVGPIAISTESLVAQNPEYEGFSKDGGRYVVKAVTAEQDIRQTGPIKLTTIDGTFSEKNNTKTYLTAVRGTFDTKANVLELMERIDITGDSGLKAVLTQATVFTKDGRIVSGSPVAVTMPSGTVVGNALEILQKDKLVSFRQGVKSRLLAANPQAGPSAVAAATKTGALGGAQNGPVDITSERLDIDDAGKVAVFRGDVVARQGEAVVHSASLQAFYEGAPPGTAGATASATAGDGKLKLIVFPEPLVMTQGTDRVTASRAEFDVRRDTGLLIGDVVIVSGNEGRATSDRAEIDNKADSAVLIGNVMVNQGRNVLKGRRLTIDRRSGRSQLASPAEGPTPRGRIAARFYQAGPGADGVVKPAPKKAPGKSDEPLLQAFQADPNTPIDIESDVLDADDKAKTATFRGQVKAVQGDYTMTAAELIATYSGDTGLGMGGQAPPAPAQKGQGAQLQKVVARQKVLVVAKDGTSAVGDTADFDTKANRIVMTGNVTLTQPGAITTGQKAVFDLNTGRANIIDDAAPGAPRSRPVFMGNPDLMKELQQKKKAEAQSAAPAKTDQPAASKSAPATSSWGTQTKASP